MSKTSWLQNFAMQFWPIVFARGHPKVSGLVKNIKEFAAERNDRIFPNVAIFALIFLASETSKAKISLKVCCRKSLETFWRIFIKLLDGGNFKFFLRKSRSWKLKKGLQYYAELFRKMNYVGRSLGQKSLSRTKK